MARAVSGRSFRAPGYLNVSVQTPSLMRLCGVSPLTGQFASVSCGIVLSSLRSKCLLWLKRQLDSSKMSRTGRLARPFVPLAERAVGQASCGRGAESQERGTLPPSCPGLSWVFFFVLFDGLDAIRRSLCTQPMLRSWYLFCRQPRWKIPCLKSHCPRDTWPLEKQSRVTVKVAGAVVQGSLD